MDEQTHEKIGPAAKRMARLLMDEHPEAVESHEGVALLLALAYLYGTEYGTEQAVTAFESELRKLA